MNRVLPLIVATVFVGSAAECRAEVAVGSSLEWHTCASELVVVGRVEKVVSTRAPKEVGNVVSHEVTVEVKEVIKGKAEGRITFYLDSYRDGDDNLLAACLRSSEPTLLFLTKSKDAGDKLMPTKCDWMCPVFELASPGRYAFDRKGNIRAKKDAILKTCRDTATRLADHLKQYPNGRVVAKRVDAGNTPADKVLYAGSATFLLVPEFESGEKK